MRIAIFATAMMHPPENYGGTERVVYHLAEELAKQKNDVTVFANKNSKIPGCKIVPITIDHQVDNYLSALKREAVANGRFDIIHDHSNDGFRCKDRWNKFPYVNTTHGEGHFAEKNQIYISKRHAQLNKAPNNPVVYDGLDSSKILFRDKKKNYLLYLGRIDKQKVPHVAIDVAKATNNPLILAGPVCDFPYFEEKIKPELNEKIRWIGNIGGRLKDELFADAKAFIFTSNWREPFGLTMIEAMFAGTPVITQDNGKNAVNEIVKEGVGGFNCKTVNKMIEAVGKLDKLEPRLIRYHADMNFTKEIMTNKYTDLYNKVISGLEW